MKIVNFAAVAAFAVSLALVPFAAGLGAKPAHTLLPSTSIALA